MRKHELILNLVRRELQIPIANNWVVIAVSISNAPLDCLVAQGQDDTGYSERVSGGEVVVEADCVYRM